jgi:hypothetical protein
MMWLKVANQVCIEQITHFSSLAKNGGKLLTRAVNVGNPFGVHFPGFHLRFFQKEKKNSQ